MFLRRNESRAKWYLKLALLMPNKAEVYKRKAAKAMGYKTYQQMSEALV